MREVVGKAKLQAILTTGRGQIQQDSADLMQKILDSWGAGITELYTAFSRGDGPKTYVQNLVAAEQDRVWKLIEDGAIIFVCGDGSKMEPDFKAALVSIYRERKRADAAAGQRWIEDLGTKNRYVLDVWAGG